MGRKLRCEREGGSWGSLGSCGGEMIEMIEIMVVGGGRGCFQIPRPPPLSSPSYILPHRPHLPLSSPPQKGKRNPPTPDTKLTPYVSPPLKFPPAPLSRRRRRRRRIGLHTSELYSGLAEGPESAPSAALCYWGGGVWGLGIGGWRFFTLLYLPYGHFRSRSMTPGMGRWEGRVSESGALSRAFFSSLPLGNVGGRGIKKGWDLCVWFGYSSALYGI